MKSYSFEKLEETALKIYLELISKDETGFEARATNIEAGVAQQSPSQIQQKVDNLRKQAWGLAEAFLDKGDDYRKETQLTETEEEHDSQGEEAKPKIKTKRPSTKKAVSKTL